MKVNLGQEAEMKVNELENVQKENEQLMETLRNFKDKYNEIAAIIKEDRKIQTIIKI